MLLNLTIFLTSLLISYILIIKIIPFLTLDIPNERSSHSKPVYRGGGIVFIIISLITTPFTKFYSLFFLLPLIITGYLDDLYSLSPKIRYFIQLFTVFLIINSNFNLPINHTIFTLLFLIIGTGIINFSNFIDGIDGLLASNMIILFLHLTIFNGNDNLYPLIGSLVAFFLLNKSPAKVFMGDIGSTFLGGVFFMEIIKVTDIKTFLLVLAPSIPIFLDSFSCVLARFLNKENIFLSHKKHLYQRLVSNGLSHNKVTKIYSFSSICICLSCYTYNIKYVFFTIGLILLLGLILNRFFAENFVKEND